MQYPNGNEEPVQSFTYQTVTFGLGRTSRRLFNMSLTFERATATDLQRAAEVVARAFAKAFEELARRVEQAGARQNYIIARAAVFGDDINAPPAWLIDAMRREK
jgi:hypothetical protein